MSLGTLQLVIVPPFGTRSAGGVVAAWRCVLHPRIWSSFGPAGVGVGVGEGVGEGPGAGVGFGFGFALGFVHFLRLTNTGLPFRLTTLPLFVRFLTRTVRQRFFGGCASP